MSYTSDTLSGAVDFHPIEDLQESPVAGEEWAYIEE
jgi:hypothetical protein